MECFASTDNPKRSPTHSNKDSYKHRILLPGKLCVTGNFCLMTGSSACGSGLRSSNKLSLTHDQRSGPVTT